MDPFNEAISLSHSTATAHLRAQACMAPASLVTVCNDALVTAPRHANVRISTARWTPKGNLVVIRGPATSIAQLKDATHILTTTIQSTLKEPTTSLASRANVKWSKLLINGVPTGVEEETPAHSPVECQCALALDNPSYRHLTITQLPSWVCSPSSYTSGLYLSLVGAFKDPDRSIASSIIAAKWLYLFSMQATVKRWKQKPHIGHQSFSGQGPHRPQAMPPGVAAPATANATASSSCRQLTPTPQGPGKRKRAQGRQASHALSVLSQISEEF